jgi:hypothetical protein
MAAIEVQPLLLELCRGSLDGRPLATAVEIARGHLMLAAIKEVLDRGYPKQIYARLSVQLHAREALAKLLGVDQSQFPENIWDEEGT